MKDRESFFTPAQRSLIIWQILLRTHYGNDEGDTKKVGIVRLLRKRAYRVSKQD